MTDSKEITDRDAPERYYRRSRNSIDSALDDGEISKQDYEHIVEFLEAYRESATHVPKPEGSRPALREHSVCGPTDLVLSQSG